MYIPKANGDLGRDLELPEGDSSIVDYMKALTEHLKRVLAEAGIEVPEGLWVTIHDDRDRAISELKRTLHSEAAALSQDVLKAADRLMTMAGNGVWNSPNGFDRVAREVITETRMALVTSLERLGRLEAQLIAFERRGGWEEMRWRDRVLREQRARDVAAAREARHRERAEGS